MIDSLKIFISSRVKPRSSELRAYPQIIHINLPSFTKEEPKRLFVNYCRYYKIELSNGLVVRLLGIKPNPLYQGQAISFLQEKFHKRYHHK